MTQMGAAFCAHRFDTHHAVAGVTVFLNGRGIDCGVKAGPATACIKLGVGVKQLGVAANAVVAAGCPVVFVFACEGAFGGRFAGDLKSHGFSVFRLEQLAPLRIGFLNFHEEQLISMDAAHSGASPAQLSNCGCSSQGEWRTVNKSRTMSKLPDLAWRMASSPR